VLESQRVSARSGKVRVIGTSKQPAAGVVEVHWIPERQGFGHLSDQHLSDERRIG
jgi:hypothetical protein